MSSKQLPMLYSRRSDGKVQSWSIEVRGRQFRTIAGIAGGAMVTSEWTTCEGKYAKQKNATTPESQAIKEAQAEHKKKQDEGYKLDIKDIDQANFFAPMLAHSYDDYKKLVAEAFQRSQAVYMQPKLDGIRSICEAERKMTSRNGKPIVSAPHVAEALESFFIANPTLKGDGELYGHLLADNFNKIVSLAKKGKPTPADLEESAKHLEWHNYDAYDPEHPNMTFSERYWELQRLHKLLDSAARMHNWVRNPIVLVETVEVHSIAEIEENFGRWVAMGYEGGIIRLNERYEPGKRSNALLKFKIFQDAEYTVLDVIEGVGNRSGMAGYLTFKTAEGRPFKSAIKGNVSFFRHLLQDKKNVIGKQATVKYFAMTPDGSPRFPVVKSIRDYE